MKKKLLFLASVCLSFLFCFILAGCAKTPSDSQEESLSACLTKEQVIQFLNQNDLSVRHWQGFVVEAENPLYDDMGEVLIKCERNEVKGDKYTRERGQHKEYCVNKVCYIYENGVAQESYEDLSTFYDKVYNYIPEKENFIKTLTMNDVIDFKFAFKIETKEYVVIELNLEYSDEIYEGEGEEVIKTTITLVFDKDLKLCRYETRSKLEDGTVATVLIENYTKSVGKPDWFSFQDFGVVEEPEDPVEPEGPTDPIDPPANPGDGINLTKQQAIEFINGITSWTENWSGLKLEYAYAGMEDAPTGFATFEKDSVNGDKYIVESGAYKRYGVNNKVYEYINGIANAVSEDLTNFEMKLLTFIPEKELLVQGLLALEDGEFISVTKTETAENIILEINNKGNSGAELGNIQADIKTILTFDKQLNLISLENIVQVSEEVGISQFVENFTGAVDEPAWFNIEDFAGMPVQPDPSTGGTITLDQGIEITYRGFLNKWIINWGEGAQLCLFDISCGMPNQQFAAPAARIEKTTEDGVVDYYVRVKVNYIYELNVDESRAEITTENYTAAELGITDADIIVKCWEFADEWTVAADGYAYYTCSGSILKALTTTQTNIFNTAEGASKLTLADWTSEFGGPRIIFEGTEREIVKIAGWLTIEAVSVGDAKLENWAIKAA